MTPPCTFYFKFFTHQNDIPVSWAHWKRVGTYVLLFANCNDYGRDILVEGDLVWESEHGILPGNLVGAMYFFAILAAVYLVFSILYGLGMVIFRDKLIPIQSYILASMLMGLGELMFKFLDYYTWNQNGDRTWRLLYAGKFYSPLFCLLLSCRE